MIPEKTKAFSLPVILLVIGGAFYVFFRQDIAGLAILPVQDLLAVVRCDTAWLSHLPCGNIMLYTLPDMLWYASLLLLQIAIIKRIGIIGLPVGCVAVALPFLWELLQYFHLIPGTYDIYDLAGYLITLIIIVTCKRKSLLQLLHSA